MEDVVIRSRRSPIAELGRTTSPRRARRPSRSCRESRNLPRVPGPDRNRIAAGSGAGVRRRGRAGRSERDLPERLARLGGPRSRHRAAPRARARDRRGGRGGGARGDALEEGRSRVGALHRGVRAVHAVPRRRPAGLRPPVPARLSRLGRIRRTCGVAPRRLDPGRPPGRGRLRGGREPRLPVRDLVPGGAGPGPGHGG